MIIYLLKRSDVDLLSPKMYLSKQNKTSEEPQDGNQGDRERKAFTEEDQAKLDQWMIRPLSEVLVFYIMLIQPSYSFHFPINQCETHQYDITPYFSIYLNASCVYLINISELSSVHHPRGG